MSNKHEFTEEEISQFHLMTTQCEKCTHFDDSVECPMSDLHGIIPRDCPQFEASDKMEEK